MTKRSFRRGAVTTAALIAVATAPAFAQDEKKEIQKYQQMIAEGSPAELWELGPRSAGLRMRNASSCGGWRYLLPCSCSLDDTSFWNDCLLASSFS